MLSETKAVSDTHLYQHESTSSLLPLELISSINSDHVLQYRSGNNISLKNSIRHHSVQSSIESINDNYQRFSNQKLINTHFPIANVQRGNALDISYTRENHRSPSDNLCVSSDLTLSRYLKTKSIV